jgi:hypothetical protein
VGLHHHVDLLGGVVHDHEPDTEIPQGSSHHEVCLGRFQNSAGVIVDDHFSGDGHVQEGWNRVLLAPTKNLDQVYLERIIQFSDKEDLIAPSFEDGGAQTCGAIPGEAAANGFDRGNSWI